MSCCRGGICGACTDKNRSVARTSVVQFSWRATNRTEHTRICTNPTRPLTLSTIEQDSPGVARDGHLYAPASIAENAIRSRRAPKASASSLCSRLREKHACADSVRQQCMRLRAAAPKRWKGFRQRMCRDYRSAMRQESVGSSPMTLSSDSGERIRSACRSAR